MSVDRGAPGESLATTGAGDGDALGVFSSLVASSRSFDPHPCLVFYFSG